MKNVITIIMVVFMISCSEQESKTQDNKNLEIQIDPNDFTITAEAENAIECASLDLPLNVCLDDSRLAIFTGSYVFIDGKCIFPFTVEECIYDCLKEFETENDQCYFPLCDEIACETTEDISDAYCDTGKNGNDYENILWKLNPSDKDAAVYCIEYSIIGAICEYENITNLKEKIYCPNGCQVVKDGPDYCK